MPELKREMSAEDRLRLIQTLNSLPTVQFDELSFSLSPPKGNMPRGSAAQGERSKALLDWSESPIGPGLHILESMLSKIISKETKKAEDLIDFVISGKVCKDKTSEVRAIVKLLQQKLDDSSVDYIFYEEGSIRLVLSGSLEILERLYEIGRLNELESYFNVEEVHRIGKYCSTARKTRLLQALKLRSRTFSYRFWITQAKTRAEASFDEILRLADYEEYGLNDRLFRFGLNTSERLSDWSFLSNMLIRAQDSFYTLEQRQFILSITPLLRAYERNLISIEEINSSLRSLRADELYDSVDSALRSASYLSIPLSESLYKMLDSQVTSFFLNLTDADFQGANLKGVDLFGTDLTRANFTDADVLGTIFGNNIGLSQEKKNLLQELGAVFQEP